MPPNARILSFHSIKPLPPPGCFAYRPQFRQFPQTHGAEEWTNQLTETCLPLAANVACVGLCRVNQSVDSSAICHSKALPKRLYTSIRRFRVLAIYISLLVRDEYSCCIRPTEFQLLVPTKQRKRPQKSALLPIMQTHWP
jgi:hypothetical protein